jgi:hypothetical protein
VLEATFFKCSSQRPKQIQDALPLDRRSMYQIKKNIEERNTQVQDMANIYRNANEVIGWLGNKTSDFDAGFCLLKKPDGGELTSVFGRPSL